MKMKLHAAIFAAATMVGGVAFGVNTDSLEEGQCMGKVYMPAQYKFEKVRTVSAEASQRLRVTAPKWEYVNEQVEVSPAYTVKKVVPAKYEYTTEKVVDRPARVEIKKSTDKNAGDVVCKVAIPETYRTVRRQTLVQEAQTVDVEIPAKYATIKVKRLVEDSQVFQEDIPEKYQEYTTKTLASPASYSWQQVLCKTNGNRSTVKQLQQALKSQGYNPGRIDGILGSETYSAVRTFQKRNSLAQGSITYEVLTKLGVNAH